MKHFILRISAAIALSLCCKVASAFEVDGIHYTIKGDGTCEVNSSSSGNEYSGSVVIPSEVTYEGTTYSVTSIGYRAFYECSSLTGITIPNSVTSIGERAFYGCSSLTSVRLEDGDKKLRFRGTPDDDAGYTFSKSNVQHLYLGRKTEGLPLFGSSLVNVTISNSLDSIGENIFRNCSGLTGITIPNSVTSIGLCAFWNCSSLKSITIPNSVTSIEPAAFYNCGSLNNVKLENGDKTLVLKDSIYSKHYGVFTDSKVQDLYIGRNIKGSSHDFGSSLGNLTISNSVDSIIANGMFSKCINLAVVRLEDGDSSLYIDNIFNGPKVRELYLGRTTIGYPGFGPYLTYVSISDSVDGIGDDTFSGCSGLTDVTIPNSVTSIGSSAFSGCSGLTDVTIPNSVTSIGSSAFYGCSGLTNVTIPNSVTSIGSSAFYGCSGLTGITIPNSVTSIGAGAFSYCRSLMSVTIPNSVTSMGNVAFSDCSSLTNVIIGNSVKKLGDSSFSGCTALKEISLGAGLKQIEEEAFEDSENLSKITCYSAMPPYAQFTSFHIDTYDKADVYVPQEYVNDYKNDNIWKRFFKLHGAELGGIEDVTSDDKAIGEQRIFDLQGRKLERPAHGFNIINGKKVIVK